ncbi:hypothetical protein L226DRAFT_474462 [Lentinus tigrinus ALCF2SS1-7]|uniref:uncharacterized protein n=1 Tax=Lentinus tigrinus ALCF2SS1-7 TaxID=1328758 RepID=UPI001165F919|nr:hypothetical protein L226DRAFT_474462 [Lentinus tigrinus ALCF2SS1-7]
MNLSQHSANVECIDALKKHKTFVRVANFANFSLGMFAPRVQTRFSSTLDAILERDHRLRRNFPNNVFAAMTLNLGPQTVTYRHTDSLNVPWGWCAITAVGDYNSKNGGHLILWDLGIAVEFPPGSTILIPSAILRHSNVALSEGERRSSLTQYTAGALFRWQECGFQSEASFKAHGGMHQRTAEQRWQEGVDTLCHWEELRSAIERRLLGHSAACFQ